MPSQIEVAQVVAMIGAAYPNFAPTKETVSVYYEMLKDLPLDLLRAATMQTCAEAGRKFAPSVGEIRGAVGDLLRQAQHIPSTLDAWDETCRAPIPRDRLYPLYRDGEIVKEDEYQWSHPLVKRVARQLGWPRFPDPQNLGVDRAHFFKMYEAELNSTTTHAIQLPEVLALVSNTNIKQLTARMEKK